MARPLAAHLTMQNHERHRVHQVFESYVRTVCGPLNAIVFSHDAASTECSCSLHSSALPANEPRSGILVGHTPRLCLRFLGGRRSIVADA
jgi:hypothetical protein